MESNGSVEIGYGIFDEFRKKGFASEAVEGVVKWAMEQPEIKQIEAETDPNNIASQKVLAKCGFVATGVTGEEGPRYIRVN